MVGGPWEPRPAALYLWVQDVDATNARALRAGARSESEPVGRSAPHDGAQVHADPEITWVASSAP
jgi:hypothetical protein